jgi:hypothetical protein
MCVLANDEMLCSAHKMEAPRFSDIAGTEGGCVYAGFWRRLMAAIIDAVTLYMPFALVLSIVILLIKLVRAKNGFNPANMPWAALPMLVIVRT